ncbi:MAG TPA: GGDEF domain-containing protein [Usitatibacter sp.]|nr:GGDEF domain-containing protein [Usitatibacter sp.]
MLFAILTVAWIAVDAIAFEEPVVVRLAALRVAAGSAFLALALEAPARPPALRAAEARLALLFAVPALFYLASTQVLAQAPRAGSDAAAASLYALVPFVLAAGIAAFPLTPVESAALGTIALLAEGWAFAFGVLPHAPLVPLGSLWLLCLIALVASFSALSQLRLLDELVGLAMRDPLTGCHRRESGKEILEAQFLVASRHRTPLAVLFADLDLFKSVNDRFGHEAGDLVLAAAAAGLRGITRQSDLVLRWGGEEFVVALPMTTLSEAVTLLARVRERGLGRTPDGRAVTVSVGVAEMLADRAGSADALIEIADRRMYQAKQAGRNRYVEAAPGARPLMPESTLAACM